MSDARGLVRLGWMTPGAARKVIIRARDMFYAEYTLEDFARIYCELARVVYQDVK